MGWFGGLTTLVGIGLDWFANDKAKDAAEEQGKDQAEQYRASAEANAEISRFDANVEKLYAMESIYSTNETIAKHRMDVESFLANQETRYAKSGVAVDTGTPLEVAQKSISNAKKDEYVIRHEGRKEAETHMVLSERYKKLANKGLKEGASYASMAMKAGSDKADAYFIKGISTGISNIYDYGSDKGWFE